MAFLYFIPGLQASASDEEITRRIPGRFDGSPVKRGCHAGPNGAPGIVVADRSMRDACGYYPEKQEWADAGEVWVGYSEKPTPEDLQRQHGIPGSPFALGDGNAWFIPILRHAPRAMTFEAGKWTQGGVVPEYQEAWETMSEWMDVRMASMQHVSDGKGEEELPADLAEKLEFSRIASSAAQILAVNYRLGDVEASILGLFTTANVADVLNTACDLQTLYDLAQKKTPQEPESTEPGETD